MSSRAVRWNARILILTVVLRMNSISNADETERPSLTALKTSSKTYVGILEKAESRVSNLLLEDVATGKVRKLSRAELKGEPREVSDTEAIELTKKPAAVIAWRISQSISGGPSKGKVASTSGGLIYTTLGEGEVSSGDELLIHRGETVIKDPDTGEVLGRQRRLVARLEVVSVQGKLSKAKMIGDLETSLQVGDLVEFPRPGAAIAVLPVTDKDGTSFEGTVQLSDEILNQLVRRKVKVVERAKLLQALEELVIQSTGLFDKETTSKIGKLAGATHLITGSVARARGTGLTAQFNVRLVSVGTGEVESSTIFKTYPFRFVPAGEAGTVSSSSGRRRKIDVSKSLKNVVSATEKGSWVEANGGVMNSADLSIISLPVEASGSYQLELEINRLSGDNALMIFFPVGSSAGSYHISHGGRFADGEYHALDYIDGKFAWKNETRTNGRIPNGQWIKVSLDVSIRRDKATIEATLDGKRIIKWEGDVSRIAPSPGWHVANKKRFGLGVQRSRVAFRNIEISGSGKLVR